MTTGGFRPARLHAGAMLAVLSLLLSACYTQMARDHRAASPDTRPYYCDAVGDGTPPGDLGHGNGSHVHPIYEGMTKGPLSWEDCERLSNQLDALLHVTEDWRTRAEGEAAGWREAADYVPGLGTHHTRGGRGPMAGASDPAAFDPTSPQILVYGGVGPDAPLVGLSYVIPGAGNRPPEAFAGSNDWWHLHTKICVPSDPNAEPIDGDSISDEECAAMGGTQIPLGNGFWLLHVWIFPGYQTKFDIFVSGHPCLGETAPLPLEDPCWDIVNHEPADGPLPGTGDGEHGADEGHGHR
jgi:hypothetical protein